MVMAALNSNEPADVPPESEQQHLNDALDNVDPLLMASLRDDERKRCVRRRWLLAGGVLAMVVVATIILFSVFAQNTPSGRAAELTAAGWRLWQSNKMQEAELKFAEAVTLDPDSENAWNGLGWSRFNLGKTDEAIVAFQRCVEIAETHPAANNGLGQAFYMQREFEKAEQYLLKAAPQASAAWYGLLKLYLLQENFEAARQWGDKIAEQRPDDPMTGRLLAAAKTGQLDDELRRLIEPPQPSRGGTAAQRGWRLFNQGSMTAAQSEFEKALALDADNLSAVNGLGFCLLNLGKPANAKPLFEKILEKTPDAGGPLNGLARCLKAEGKVDEAITTWEKLARQSDSVNAATVGLAQTHFERGEFEKAVRYLQKLVEAAPDNQSFADMLKKAKRAREEP